MTASIERNIVDTRPAPITLRAIPDRKRYVTSTGRPLFELHADDEIIDRQENRGILFDLRPSVLPGSRALMAEPLYNHSALLELNRNRKDIFNGFSWIHNQYFKGGSPDSLTAKQAHELAAICGWLPVYGVNRAENPLDKDAIPVAVANMYKASEGICTATSMYVYDNGGNALVTAEILYETADKPIPDAGNKSLLTGGGLVCAAPKSIILGAMDALLMGKGGNPAESSLTAYFSDGEFPRIRGFAQAMEQIMRFELDKASTQDQNILKARKDIQKAGGKQKELGNALERERAEHDFIVGLQLAKANKMLGRRTK